MSKQILLSDNQRMMIRKYGSYPLPMDFIDDVSSTINLEFYDYDNLKENKAYLEAAEVLNIFKLFF